MALSLKQKLLKILNSKDDDNVDNVSKQLSLTDKEINELVEKRANELLEKELATLDKAFLKEVSDKIKSIEFNDIQNQNNDEKSQEDKVKDILNNQGDKNE